MKVMLLPIGALLRLSDREHVYSIIVLDYFPVIFSNQEVWHYTLCFFRKGTGAGILAFSENELSQLLISGEAEVLSKGTSNED
jgi:hypothetical protein